jgi:hypothetical protein
MVIDQHSVTYVTNVTAAIMSGKIPHTAQSAICPECDQEMNMWGIPLDGHLVFDAGDRTDDPKLFVLIGCEGYWVIDPALAGMPRGGWTPPTELVINPDDAI